MIRVTSEHRLHVVDIIRRSFDQDPGVNYLIPQDKKREIRIMNLINYCFEVAVRSGEIYILEDLNAAAILLFPDKPLNFLTTVKLDIMLVLKSIGVRNVVKALRRESVLKAKRMSKGVVYLWFVGVIPESQGKGIGKLLLNEVINYADKLAKPLCLECSPENLEWYKRRGFEIYDELDQPPFQYFMRKS